MKIIIFILGVLALPWITGCASEAKRLAVGQPVTLEGIAEARKLGAALRGDTFDVWIDRLPDWPRGYAGRKVRVSGILEERHDLPVHIQRPGEPVSAGIAVPEGTDLRAASRRYVIRDATWSLIR